MGDCCSTDVSSSVGGAMPEKLPLKDREHDNDDSDDGESTRPGNESIEKEWQNAVNAGNNKKIKDLFRQHHKHFNFLAIKFDNGDNSLHQAVRKGNLKLVKFLLLLKMDANKGNGDGNTALHLAVELQNGTIVDDLLKQDKIDITKVNNDNKTAKDIALSKGHNRMVDLIEKYENEEDQTDPKGVPKGVPRAVSANDNGLGDSSFGKGGDTHDLLQSVTKDSYNNNDNDDSKLSAADAGAGGDTIDGSSVGDDNDSVVDSGAETLDVQTLALKVPNGDNDDEIVSSEDEHSGTEDEERPILMGYLERKGKGMGSKWEKKWCIVTKSYILFSKKEIKIHDANTPESREQFDEIINMKSVVSVVPKKSKKEQNKFVLATTTDGKPVNPHKPPSSKNELVIRCESETVRNQWVHKLIKHCKKVYNLSYLKSFNNLPGI